MGVVLRWYRRPNLSQAFLWGLAGGAGFALVEGLFNSLGGLDVWVLAVFARVGASLLHCFNGALMGIAWYSILSQRRWLQGAGLYALAVGVHGLWNALSVGMAFLSLDTLAVDPAAANGGLTGAGMFVLIAMLVAMVVALGLGLARLTQYVRRQSGTALDLQAGGASPGLEEDELDGRPEKPE
jgi:hypothetical protein